MTQSIIGYLTFPNLTITESMLVWLVIIKMLPIIIKYTKKGLNLK